MAKYGIMLHCPKCNDITPHIEVEDDIFEYAAACILCDVVWEMTEDWQEYGERVTIPEVN